jgi:four helix bundle protein
LADERFSLTSQLRRAAASVGANIAECYGRRNTQDTSRFLYIARGSLMETQSSLYLARDLGFLPYEQASSLVRDTARLSVKVRSRCRGQLRRRFRRRPSDHYLITT